MRSLHQVIFSLLLCQALMGAQAQGSWEQEFEALTKNIEASPALDDVLADLKTWDPNKAWPGAQTIYWFRDRYLNDASINGLARANFYAAVINTCHNLVVQDSLQCASLDTIGYTYEMAVEGLRLLHRMPYIFLATDENDSILSMSELCKHGAVMCSHGAMLLSFVDTSSPSLAVKISGAVVSYGMKLTSMGFSLAAAYLSTKDQYLDLALRGLLRKYTSIHREEHRIIVQAIINEQDKNKIKQE